jgi:hypothetical protein
MATVAIVTSTTFGDDNKVCFVAGMSAAGVPNAKPNEYAARGDYSSLPKQFTAALSDNADLKLIVAAGGNIAANAAASCLSSKPYIFLAGTAPTLGKTNVGGVILNTPDQNNARAALLQGIDPAKIYLVVNNNAPMRSDEVTAWQNNNVAYFFQTYPNNPTAAQVDKSFADDLDALAKNSPSGVVISADPVFRHYRHAFIKALRNHNSMKTIPVCWPFHEYKDADNAGPGKGYAIQRPQLSVPATDVKEVPYTAYYELGWIAGKYLNGNTVGIKQWDYTQNKWV